MVFHWRLVLILKCKKRTARGEEEDKGRKRQRTKRGQREDKVWRLAGSRGQAGVNKETGGQEEVKNPRQKEGRAQQEDMKRGKERTKRIQQAAAPSWKKDKKTATRRQQADIEFTSLAKLDTSRRRTRGRQEDKKRTRGGQRDDKKRTRGGQRDDKKKTRDGQQEDKLWRPAGSRCQKKDKDNRSAHSVHRRGQTLWPASLFLRENPNSTVRTLKLYQHRPPTYFKTIRLDQY